jgi:transposase
LTFKIAFNLRPGSRIELKFCSAPRRRAALLLAKYSRYLNPIQQFFAKLEHWFRKAAARAADAVCDAVGHIRATVTSAACTNYFAHAGYEQT